MFELIFIELIASKRRARALRLARAAAEGRDAGDEPGG